MTDSRLEREVEKDGTLYAEAKGWWQCKFISPGLRGVPDRLFIRTKNGGPTRVVFVEWKKDNELPSTQQIKRHRDMRDHGAEVYVFDESQWDEFKRVMA